MNHEVATGDGAGALLEMVVSGDAVLIETSDGWKLIVDEPEPEPDCEIEPTPPEPDWEDPYRDLGEGD